MSIGSFIGGRYAGTYAASGMGITRDGWDLALNPKGELINQSDAYGQTLLDFFHAGCDVDLIGQGLEYPSMLSPAWPFGTYGTMGIIARLGSAIAAAIVLTATTGTPAASTPATLTASRAIIAPGSQTMLKHSSKLREVPIRWNCLPSDALVHFTTS